MARKEQLTIDFTDTIDPFLKDLDKVSVRAAHAKALRKVSKILMGDSRAQARKDYAFTAWRERGVSKQKGFQEIKIHGGKKDPLYAQWAELYAFIKNEPLSNFRHKIIGRSKGTKHIKGFGARVTIRKGAPAVFFQSAFKATMPNGKEHILLNWRRVRQAGHRVKITQEIKRRIATLGPRAHKAADIRDRTWAHRTIAGIRKRRKPEGRLARVKKALKEGTALPGHNDLPIDDLRSQSLYQMYLSSVWKDATNMGDKFAQVREEFFYIEFEKSHKLAKKKAIKNKNV